jgi:hypothetical protein
MSMNFIQELKQIGLRQKRVEFFEEYGFIPEIDDLDIEENSEMLDAINMERDPENRIKLSDLKYETYGGFLYP